MMTRTFASTSRQAVMSWLLVLPLAAQNPLGPYTSNCNTNPASEVQDFSSLFVTLEPSLIQDLLDKCLGPLNEAAEKAAKIRGSRADLWAAASSAGGAVTAIKSATASAEAMQLYLAKCSGSAIWTNMKRSIPALQELSNMAGKASELNDAVQKGKKITADMDKAGRITPTFKEWQDIWKIANTFAGAIENVDKLSKAMNAVADVMRRPEAILPPTGALDAMVARARASTAAAAQSCNVPQAERDLKEATDRGQEWLLRARLARARAQKVERSYREGLERLFPNFQSNPLAQQDMPLGYAKWKEAYEAMQRAERDAGLLERKLGEAGQVCSELQRNANQVYQLRNDYERIRLQASQEIQACRLNAAEASLQQLRRHEAGACKDFLAHGVFEDPRTGSNPFVPSGQVSGTPAQRLDVALVAAHRTCSVSGRLPGGPKVEEIPDDLLKPPTPAGALAGQPTVTPNKREDGLNGSYREWRYTATTAQLEVRIPAYDRTDYMSRTLLRYQFENVPGSLEPGKTYTIRVSGGIQYTPANSTDGMVFGSNLTVVGDAEVKGPGAKRGPGPYNYLAGEYIVTVKPNAKTVEIELGGAGTGTAVTWKYKK